MTVEEQLRAQDWGQISAQLTMMAWRCTHRRSWQLAEDLAQDAIAEAFDIRNGWDPSRVPLMTYLGGLVFRLTRAEWRRHRNALEIALDDDSLDEPTDNLPGNTPSPETQVARRDLVAKLFERLAARLHGDEAATTLLRLFAEGVELPADQVKASSLTLDEIRSARRRLFHHAEKVRHELNEELIAQ